MEDVPRIRAFVGGAAARLGASAEAAFRLSLAVDELCTNAIAHGYDGGPGLLELRLRSDGTTLTLTIHDEAPAFDPTSVRPPTAAPAGADLEPGGLGLLLVDRVIDRFEHGGDGVGNVLTVTITDRWSD